MSQSPKVTLKCHYIPKIHLYKNVDGSFFLLFEPLKVHGWCYYVYILCPDVKRWCSNLSTVCLIGFFYKFKAIDLERKN